MFIIKRYFNRYQKIILNKYLIIGLSVLVALLILVKLIPPTILSEEARASILRNNPAVVKLLPVYWQIRKLSDWLYLASYFQKDELSVYELYIDDQARQKMDDSLPKQFMNVIYTDKVYVPAKFTYDGKTYDVEVSYRGDNAIHWNAPKKSYSIKFKKDNLFNGVSKLSFIITVDRRFILEYFNNYRADKLGLLHPASSFGSLKINGRNNGLYFIVEGWSEEMLAKLEVSDQSNFYGEDNSREIAGISRDDNLWTSLDFWRKIVSDNQFGYEHFSGLNQLLELLTKDDDKFFSSIFDLVDEDNFFAWQIHQDLIGSGHQNLANIRLYFDNSVGKFYFIPWDVEGGYNSSPTIYMGNILSARILSNPYYLYRKNKMLYDYVADKKKLTDDLDFYDKMTDNIWLALHKDQMRIYSIRWAKRVIDEVRQNIVDNIDKVKDIFGDGLIFANVDVGDHGRFFGHNIIADINVKIQSFSGVFLDKVNFKMVDGLDFTAYKMYYDSNFNGQLDAGDQLVDNYDDFLIYSNLIESSDKNYQPELTSHHFFVVADNESYADFSDNLVSVTINAKNAITGKKIKSNNFEVKITNSEVFKYFSNISDIDKFQRENPNFRVDRQLKEIILPSGVYNINQTIIVPKDFTLKILPGTTLRLASGVSVVSYGNIMAQGTASASINFVAQSNSPWGVIAVIDGDQKNHFSHCNFSGGRDDYINGAYLSGMLSVYHADVEIDNCVFSGARADDALNVKKSDARVTNSEFRNNSADAIDFDFIKSGAVTNNRFFYNGNDGIDISGSTIVIRDNYIEKSGDKCISVGEKSLNSVIYNNILNGCDIGVEIKDLSDIWIINNIIIGNRLGINAYQKKEIFGGGRAKVYNSIIWDNEIDVQTDDQSEILIYNSDLAGGSDNNFSISPIFSPTFYLTNQNDDKLMTGGNTKILKQKLDIDLQQAPVGLIK